MEAVAMSVYEHAEYDQHESVHFFQDSATGLKAIIAIHSTALGPAAGGCRRWQYASDNDALTDVLRLSRGMTYKNAIAGLPFGGGKAVILADDTARAPAELFTEFGRVVDSLNGKYITAEDVGISVDDMRVVRRQTQYVTGLPQSGHHAGGDPSPWTALGVFLGMQAAVKHRLGVDTLKGIKVAVQGVGHVGYYLCKLLADAGAEILVADVNRASVNRVRDEFGAIEVAPADILFREVDVIAPCALGSIFDEQSIDRLHATVIAGAANNQLTTEADGALLTDRGILYSPDYVINGGGIVSAAREYMGNSSEDQVRSEVERIPARLSGIFDEAQRRSQPTNVVADELARSIVSAAAAEEPAAVVNG
jgi:leucine dehydrogenase